NHYAVHRITSNFGDEVASAKAAGNRDSHLLWVLWPKIRNSARDFFGRLLHRKTAHTYRCRSSPCHHGSICAPERGHIKASSAIDVFLLPFGCSRFDPEREHDHLK